MAANRESVNAIASKPPMVEPSSITTRAMILLALNDISLLQISRTGATSRTEEVREPEHDCSQHQPHHNKDDKPQGGWS